MHPEQSPGPVHPLQPVPQRTQAVPVLNEEGSVQVVHPPAAVQSEQSALQDTQVESPIATCVGSSQLRHPPEVEHVAQPAAQITQLVPVS